MLLILFDNQYMAPIYYNSYLLLVTNFMKAIIYLDLYRRSDLFQNQCGKVLCYLLRDVVITMVALIKHFICIANDKYFRLELQGRYSNCGESRKK